MRERVVKEMPSGGKIKCKLSEIKEMNGVRKRREEKLGSRERKGGMWRGRGWRTREK